MLEASTSDRAVSLQYDVQKGFNDSICSFVLLRIFTFYKNMAPSHHVTTFFKSLCMAVSCSALFSSVIQGKVCVNLQLLNY